MEQLSLPPTALAPDFLPEGLAFVDIETNGGPAQRESITEVAIIELDREGLREWSTLVRPGSRIPEHIERLTGISNAMVANAPGFHEVADAIYDRLEGRLFVAHNARFDHGYLRAALRRAGLDIRPRVLCTVKLSRRLFPDERRHGLDQLIARHALAVEARHRALGDARALLQFWQHIHEHFPPGLIAAAVRALIGQSSLPPQLDAAAVEALPDTPGVYLFYGENELPLYVGKSLRIRSRVRAHFSADHSNDRELSLSQQVRRIDWRETAGELGALLLEARLIKDLQPTHNRLLRRNRELCAWRLAPDMLGDAVLGLAYARDLDFGSGEALFGLFRSRRAATERLRELAREHALCPPLLGLEKREPGARCFTHQIRRCHGACHGGEAPAEHAARLRAALESLRLESWPHPGAMGIAEGGVIHVIDAWRYFGSAPAAEARTLLENGRPDFDLDIYRILVKAVVDGTRLVPLPGCGAAP